METAPALVQKAEEDLAVTAARLANRLNLDPSVRLEPIGGPLVPLTLVPIETPQQELLQVALHQRPDIAARTAAIGEAEAHLKQEVARPLLPTLWLGYSGGAFGGGSNLTPPLVGNFASRSDFDVDVYWTVMNLGAGNLALIKGRRAQVGQALAERARTINRARDEISASLAEARAAQNEIDVARASSNQPSSPIKKIWIEPSSEAARNRAMSCQSKSSIAWTYWLVPAFTSFAPWFVTTSHSIASGSHSGLRRPCQAITKQLAVPVRRCYPRPPIVAIHNYLSFDPGAAKGIQKTGYERMSWRPKGSMIRKL